MTSSMQAAIFLGKDYFENLHSVRNTDKRPIVQSLFEVTQKLVHEQKLGISGLTDLSWNKSSWKKLALADGEESIKLMKAKVHVFSDSVLCVWKTHDCPYSNIDWENRISWFRGTHRCRELDEIDGDPVEFEWRIYPGHTSLQIVYEMQKLMDSLK